MLQYAPGLLSNYAVNFFLDSSKRQGWMGNSLELWARRRNNKGRNSGRANLIDTGRLRRSIRISYIHSGMDIKGADLHMIRRKRRVSL